MRCVDAIQARLYLLSVNISMISEVPGVWVSVSPGVLNVPFTAYFSYSFCCTWSVKVGRGPVY